MSIVESDGPRSWSLDASETGGEYKIPVGRGDGVCFAPISRSETKMAARGTRYESTFLRKMSIAFLSSHFTVTAIGISNPP